MKRITRAMALACALALASLPAAAQGTGLVFLEPDRYRSIPLAPPTGLTSIPAEMDLSKDFPTPGDQGSQGSCVGWAVGYALKSYQERRERLWKNWDDTKRMSPAFVYNQIKVGGCDDGARIADALDLVTSTGAAAWADQPYSPSSCNDLPTALAKQNAAVNRVAAWFRVNPQDRQAIKTSIAAGLPVVVGMRVDDRFKALKAGETWRGGGVPAEAHAMVVVGYSDSRDAVKVINSWGTDWGDEGFGWIDFETFRSVTREAYVAQDIVLPVGMAERREHPYTVKTGPYGPVIFGLQLGMTSENVRNKLSREGNREKILLTDGQSRQKIVVEAKEIDTTATFWIDEKNDYLDYVEVSFMTYQGRSYEDPLTKRIFAFLNALPINTLTDILTTSKPKGQSEQLSFSERVCTLLKEELESSEIGASHPELARKMTALELPSAKIQEILAGSGHVCVNTTDGDFPRLTYGSVPQVFEVDIMGASLQIEADLRRSTGVSLRGPNYQQCTFREGAFFEWGYLGGSAQTGWGAMMKKPLPRCTFGDLKYTYQPKVNVKIRASREETDVKFHLE